MVYEAGGGEGIARLFAAARVGLWADGLASGEAALPLTATATARALVDHAGAQRTAVDEALGWYMDGTRTGHARAAAGRWRLCAQRSAPSRPTPAPG